MPFAARSAAEIRDDLLAQWASDYRARSLDLAIDQDSDAYAEADALSLVLESLEIQAQQNAMQVLLSRSSGGALDDFAGDDGTSRKPAVSARRHVAVSGPVSTTTSLSGQYLTSSSGLRYDPIASDGSALGSITTDSAGDATILAECARTGPLGNVATGTVLTWSTPPTSYASTATVSATSTSRREGTSIETDAVLKLRLLDRRRERPASGNRSDWREKVREVSDVSEAYVFPLARPPASYPGASTPQTLGCVTVLACGPVRTDIDEPVNSRFAIGGAASAGLECTSIEAFIEGTRDADLNVVTNGRQWRPASLAQANYAIKTPRSQAQNVTLELVLSASRPFPWTYDGAMVVHSSSSTTSLVATGDHTAKNGKAALVQVGTSVICGGYQLVTLPTGTYNGGTGRTTWSFVSTPFRGAPVSTSVVLPAPPDWTSIKTSVVEFFDEMGPGEYTGAPSGSERFPPPDVQSPSTLYPSALGARVINDVPSVLSATVTTPSTAATPVDEYMLDLGLLVVRAP